MIPQEIKDYILENHSDMTTSELSKELKMSKQRVWGLCKRLGVKTKAKMVDNSMVLKMLETKKPLEVAKELNMKKATVYTIQFNARKKSVDSLYFDYTKTYF
jgi:predicted transcriptional regulator